MGATEEYQTTAEGGKKLFAAVRTAIILSRPGQPHTTTQSLLVQLLFRQ